MILKTTYNHPQHPLNRFGSPSKAEDVKGASFQSSGTGGTSASAGGVRSGSSIITSGHHHSGGHDGSVVRTPTHTIYQSVGAAGGAGAGRPGLGGSRLSGGHTSSTGTSSFSAFAG